jgi:hypothetical protein
MHTVGVDVSSILIASIFFKETENSKIRFQLWMRLREDILEVLREKIYEVGEFGVEESVKWMDFGYDCCEASSFAEEGSVMN